MDSFLNQLQIKRRAVTEEIASGDWSEEEKVSLDGFLNGINYVIDFLEREAH